MATCPKCVKGQLGFPVHIRWADGQAPKSEQELKERTEALCTCDFCQGTGEITDQQLQWTEIGSGMKRTRLLAGLGLRQAAERLGLLPSLLSNMESGRCQPDPKVLEGLTDMQYGRS